METLRQIKKDERNKKLYIIVQQNRNAIIELKNLKNNKMLSGYNLNNIEKYIQPKIVFWNKSKELTKYILETEYLKDNTKYSYIVETI